MMTNDIRSIIEQEADAVRNIPISERYAEAVDLIVKHVHKQGGTLITAGMGKAGQIAMNMATTFSSTGTPAFFLHPGEAQHGDLGIVRRNDLLLLVSNSGKTLELIELVDLARGLVPDIPFILITSDPQSELARRATLCLPTGAPREVCTLGLTPTTSTTVMTVIGDVLVVGTMDRIGFTSTDYAKRHNQPCVVSFSEGSSFRFDSDTQLYHAFLDSLQGPGRIIVAAAGNEGGRASYLRKPLGTDSAGTFIKDSNGRIGVSAKSKAHFLLRLRFHRVGTLTTYDIDTRALVAAKDSQLIDTLTFGKLQYEIQAAAYQPDNEGALAYEMYLRTLGSSTYVPPTALVLIGANADVELFRGAGRWETNKLEPALLGGDDTHTILSPASAPAVIAVGATSYRTHITNYKGEKKYSLKGTGGERAPYSSKGPTTDGRTKPDVMAPGSNII